MTCSKCEEPSTKSILVYTEPAPQLIDPKDKDLRGVQVVRFCKTHWAEVEALLP